MRVAFYISSAIAVLITGAGCTTQSTNNGRSAAGTVLTAPGNLVTIQYLDPQGFTDFRIHDRDVRYSASVFAQEIGDDLKNIVNDRFPGYRLTLRFTNIDLAGHGTVGSRSVRVVRTHRPARLSVTRQGVTS